MQECLWQHVRLHAAPVPEVDITPGQHQTFTIALGQEHPVCTGLQEIKPEGKYVGWQKKSLWELTQQNRKFPK